MIRKLNDKKNDYGTPIYYYGGVVDGKRSGFGIEYPYSENIFIGQFKENERHGFGIDICHPYTYEAEFGYWDLGNKNGLSIECTRYDQHGTRDTDAHGPVLEFRIGEYRKGRLTGKFLEYTHPETLWVKYQGANLHVDLGVAQVSSANMVCHVGLPIGTLTVDTLIDGELIYTGQVLLPTIYNSSERNSGLNLNQDIKKEHLHGIGRIVSLVRTDEMVIGNFRSGLLHGVCFATEAYGFRLIGEWQEGVFKKGLLWQDEDFSEVTGIDQSSPLAGHEKVMSWNGIAGDFRMKIVETVSFKSDLEAQEPINFVAAGEEVKKLSINGENIFYVDYYYPKRIDSLPEEKMTFRENIWRFKSGSNSSWAKGHLFQLVKHAITYLHLEHPIICAIPASTQYRTQQRYHSILEEASKMFLIENGYSCIAPTTNRQPKHFGLGHFDAEKHIDISPAIKGKDILLFDDVYTSGATYHQVKKALLAKGAKSVHGLFIAKTKSRLD